MKPNTISRRQVLEGAAGLGTLSVAGGVGLLFGTQRARAVGSSDLGSVAIESNDGSVEYVAIFGDSVVSWLGFDTPAHSFDISIELEVVSDWDGQTQAQQVIHETNVVNVDDDTWGNHDEEITTEDGGRQGTIKSGIGLGTGGNHNEETDWHVVGTDPDGYGLPGNPVDASALDNGHDGDTRLFKLHLRSTYTWYDENENPIFDETFPTTLDVEVTNIESQADASDGDGEDGAVGA